MGRKLMYKGSQTKRGWFVRKHRVSTPEANQCIYLLCVINRDWMDRHVVMDHQTISTVLCSTDRLFNFHDVSVEWTEDAVRIRIDYRHDELRCKQAMAVIRLILKRAEKLFRKED